MRLSTRARYGTRALMELALNRENEPVFLKDIARRQEISLSYLEQLMAPLIAGSIIRSTKGPRGGISLVKNPEDIKLSEIIRLLEGSTAPVECIDDHEVCDRSESCATRDVWSELKMAIDRILESTTLQNLVERHKKKNAVEPAMFYI